MRKFSRRDKILCLFIGFIYTQMLHAFGKGYEYGLDGCDFDPQKAFEFYTQLVKDDSAWGNALLGDTFFLNELIESDDQRAYNYYRLGANNNDAYCFYRLALMNYYGVGTARNREMALHYKNRAIELGFSADSFSF